MLWKRMIGMIAVCSIAAILMVSDAMALVLTGYFPVQQGRFWNFSSPGEKLLSTWAINGAFTERNVGHVFVLQQDNCRFVSMRDEWGGLYIYGEYETGKYFVPNKAMPFLPREMDIEKPVQAEVLIKVYSAPGGMGNYRETEQIKRTITINLKSIEDLTVDNEEVRNCAVIERTTNDNGAVVVETLWLAPTIGPIKREVKRAAAEKTSTYTVTTYADSKMHSVKQFATKDYFPLKAGITIPYKSSDGAADSIEITKQEKVDQWLTTPCVINMPDAISPNDIFYYVYTPDGLMLPQIFRSAMKSYTAFLPPQAPVRVLPNTLKIGAFTTSTSYPRICKYPSRTPNLDFTTELQFSSIPVYVEDVTVPAGEFKGCIKICLFNISRAFEFKMEKIRVGYQWLAKGKGIVKLQQVEFGNYFMPERLNEFSSVQFWELTKEPAPVKMTKK
jgi:hypothetical protein